MSQLFGLSMIVWIFLGCMQVKEKKATRPLSAVSESTNQYERTSDGEVILKINSASVLQNGQTYEADRIIFESGTILWFQSGNIQFKARSIQFEQPVLIGFYPSQQLAAFAQYGNAGGLVKFSAEKISGNIQLHLAGQNGGEGYHGGGFRIPRTSGSVSELIECPPAIGASGGAGGWVMMDSLDLSLLQIKILQTQSEPGRYGIAYLKEGFDLQKSIQENRTCRAIPYQSNKGTSGRLCLKSESLLDTECASRF